MALVQRFVSYSQLQCKLKDHSAVISMKSDIPHMYSCPGKVLLPLCHHNDKCNSLASWHTSVHTAVLHIHLYLQRPAKKREENSYQIYLNMNYLVKKKKEQCYFVPSFTCLCSCAPYPQTVLTLYQSIQGETTTCTDTSELPSDLVILISSRNLSTLSPTDWFMH